MDYRIAIVNSSSFGTRFPDQMDRLRKIGEVERVRVAGTCCGAELAKALEGFNVVISSVTPFFDKEFFENKRDLVLLSRHGIGYNNIDIPAAEEAGCLVTTVSPLVERDPVAEGAVAILLDAMRRVSDSHVAANEGRWAERASFVGNGLSGKTLGIIGCGNIGSRVVEILARGYDMKVLACDPVHHDDWAAKLGVPFEYTDVDTVVANCDVLTLNADLNPTSFHILNADVFSKMLDGITNGYIVGFTFYVVGFLMTSLLYNRAVSTVLIPLVVITCSSIGCDPRGPIILVALSTMSSLVTPMATALYPWP